jgi:hypothetical protein
LLHTCIEKNPFLTLIQLCFSNKNEEQRYHILLLVETNLSLSKTFQNLIMNINRTRSFKCFNQYICPVWWTDVSTNNWYSNGCELWSTTCRFVSTSFKGFSRIKIDNKLRPSIPASAIKMMFCH